MAHFLSDRNTEDIIIAIEKRPALYFKGNREYSNPEVKKRLWCEVCAEVVKEWKHLSPEEKTNIITEVQRRWHNVRTCFGRELRNQKSVKTDMALHRRRKYIYFDKLQFLLPSYEAILNESEAEPDVSNDELSSESNTVATVKPTVKRKRKENKSNVEEPALPLPERLEEIPSMDEDTYFVLSLVPSLRGLSYHEKLEAKMRILDVFRKIRPPPSTSVRRQRPLTVMLQEETIQDEGMTELELKSDMTNLIEFSEDYRPQD